MTIVGNTYLERGEPVEIVRQWRTGAMQNLTMRLLDGNVALGNTNATTGPRNVLIRRANGDLVVRPFRGLRKAD